MENQNNDAKLTAEQRMYQDVEVLAQEINQGNLGKDYTTSTFPGREGIWSNEELSDEEELARAKKRQQYFYHSKNRTNMSKEADEIMEKLKRGEAISRKEEFTLTCDDSKKVEEWAKVDDLKQKAKTGQLTEQELRYLTDTVYGKDSNKSKEVYDAMIKGGRVKSGEQERETGIKTSITREDDLTRTPSKKNEFIADLESKVYTKEEIAKNDVKEMKQPTIEQPVIQAPVTQGPELVI